MNLTQLKTLLEQGESENLEFKSSTGSLNTGMQTVCAFLNSTQGGTLVFGVKDDGQIIGQDVSDKTRKEIAIELHKIEPYAKIDIEYLSTETDKNVIILTVQPGDKAPYSYDGRFFTRSQSTTMRMTREEYGYIYNQNNMTLWETLTNNDCTLKDLDEDRIKEIVHTAVFEKRLPTTALTASIPDILTKLKLLVDGKLTNAAVVLFCKNEDKQFMQSQVKLARFKGIDKKEFLDTKLYVGNAFDLYDKTMDYLTFCLPVAARIEQGNPIRVETPTIPYSVLREAITNALIHRDYSFPGGSIAVAIYDDRVNIMNMGALPKGIEISKLSTEHTSIQRNPLIANVFYVCGKIEKWGRGTLDMIKDCKSVGNPIPDYEEIGGVFSITLPFKEPIRTIITEQAQEVIILTDRQKEILHILKDGPLSRHEITAKMQPQLTDRTMQLELTNLKKMNLIISNSKAKATTWSLI